MMGFTLPQVKQRTGMIIFDATTTPPPLDKKTLEC
jgi:hypothetical protein